MRIIEGQAYEEPALQVTSRMTQAYGEVNSDSNAIHYDEDAARRAGFPAPLVHGAIVAAYVHRALERVFGRGWLRAGRLDLRFRSPVYVGESLAGRTVIENIVNENGRTLATATVSCRTDDGREVVTGRAVARFVGGPLDA